MLSIEVIINIADPSQIATYLVPLLLYLLCGKDLLCNKGSKKKNVNLGVEIEAFNGRHVLYIDRRDVLCCRLCLCWRFGCIYTADTRHV
jgi:hypothetical protein